MPRFLPESLQKVTEIKLNRLTDLINLFFIYLYQTEQQYQDVASPT